MVVVDTDEVESCDMRQEALVWGGAIHSFRCGGGGRANEDDKTNDVLQHLFPGSQIQRTVCDYTEKNISRHSVQYISPNIYHHIPGQAISALRWRPFSQHQI